MHPDRMYRSKACRRGQRTGPWPNHYCSALVGGSLSVYGQLFGRATHGGPHRVSDDVGDSHIPASFCQSTRSHSGEKRSSPLSSGLVSRRVCCGTRHPRPTRDTAAPPCRTACVLAALVAAVELGKADGGYSLDDRW